MSLYVLLASTLLFFAFTRTRAGRAELQRQLEIQFAARFDGKLEIGSLEGNVVYNLLARNVRLMAPDGSLVLSVDTIRARPAWSGLIKRSLELDRLDVRGATVSLEQDSTGSWNVTRALRLRRFRHDRTGSEQFPELVLPRLLISRSSIRLNSDAPLPEAVERNWVFNYRREEYEIREARVAMDWTASSRQIDVIDLRGRISGSGLELSNASAQIVFSSDRFDVTDLQVETPGSRVSAVAGFDSPATDSDAQPAAQIRINADRLDATELSQVFPAQPLRRPIGLKLDATGTKRDFLIREATIAHGRSHLTLSGLASTEDDSIHADVTLNSDYIAVLDVDALLPDRGIARFYPIDTLSGDIYIQANLPTRDPFGGDFAANLQSDVQSGGGGFAATAVINRSGGDLAYTANVSAADLDASALSGGRLPPSLLTGSAFASATSADLRRASGRLDVAIQGSWYDGVPIDSLAVNATATDGAYDGTVRLVQDRSLLESDYTIDLATDERGIRVAATANAQSVDLGTILNRDFLSTSLTARSRIEWRQTPDQTHGSVRLDLDDSDVRLASYNRTIPTSRTTAAISSDGRGTRATVDGDLLSGSLESSLTIRQLESAIPDLATELIRRATAQLPPSYAPGPDPRNPTADLPSSLADATQDGANSTADSVSRPRPARQWPPGRSPAVADLAIDLRLRADSTVASLIARRRLFARNMRARVDVTSDSTGYRFFAESRADSVHAGASIAVAPHIRLAGTLGEDTLGFAFDRADVEVSAAALVQNNRLVANPAFHANLEGSQLDVRIAATESPSIGPVDIGLVAERTDARWRMHFDRFLMIASGYSVSSAGEHEINLYRNAVAVNGLKFTSPGPAGQQQTLELAGTYSPLSTDTMSVSAHGVDLLRLSAFAGLQQPVAGAANGRVEVVRVDGIPVLAGELQVDRLGLDDRILGNLTANSRFRARGNEVDVTAVLSPVSDSLASGLNTVANDLTLDGAIRFERDGSERRTELELVADIRRADLFFFEYVFPQTIDNVEGSIVGTSTITGTLSRPEFNAQLELPAGSFTVPEFNIGLGVTGTLAVDREGIRIRRATLTDATGGIATISGSVLFNDYRFFSLDLSGDLNDLHIMNIAHSTELPFYGNIRGSGQIMLDGPISRATLRTTDARTNPESEVYIPIVAPVTTSDEAFIVFADSSGVVTDPIETERRNVLSSRPRGERSFLDGLELDLNLFAPEGTTVHLVIDPLLGDVINAVGTGRVQIRRREGEFSTFGTLNVTSGDYLFTAGDVFVRRFGIDSGGSITWDGDPTNAILDIRASYETRASRAGLPGSDGSGSAIPLIVRLRITGRVETPEVALSLEVDRTNRDLTGNYAALEAILNQPSRSTEYATSVLVSNSFLLTTSEVRTDVLASSAFNSVSQLVASQINRYLNEALPNVDFSFGVQGESTQELGVTYGIALRLLDERLVIRGQGVYQGARTETADVSNQNLEGEFVVEVKLSPTVSVEVFYRREGDVLTNNATLTGSTGAGVSYSTEFSTWRRFFSRIFGTSKSQPAEADSSIPQ